MKPDHKRTLTALGYLNDQQADEQAEQPEQEQQDTPTADPLAKDRARACRDNGLPQAMASRLQGSTAAGITADAMRLARELQAELAPPVNAEVQAIEAKAKAKRRRIESILPSRAWSEREGKEHQ